MIGANVRHYVDTIVSAEAFDRSLDFLLDLDLDRGSRLVPADCRRSVRVWIVADERNPLMVAADLLMWNAKFRSSYNCFHSIGWETAVAGDDDTIIQK